MTHFTFDDLIDDGLRMPTQDDVVPVPTYDPATCSVPGTTPRLLMSAPALDEEGEYEGSARFEVADLAYAHIATSIRTDGRHRKPFGTVGYYHAPLLDLDVPHAAEQGRASGFFTSSPEAENEWVLTLDVTATDAFLRDAPVWANLRYNFDGRYIGHLGKGYFRNLNIVSRMLSDLDLGSITARVTTDDMVLVTWRMYGDRFVLSPTSTPGHSHLYIDARLPEVTYMRLLVGLARIGVVEPGFVRAAIHRGHSAGRLPWVKKGTLILSSEFKPEPTEPVTVSELNEFLDGKSNLDPALPYGDDW